MSKDKCRRHQWHPITAHIDKKIDMRAGGVNYEFEVFGELLKLEICVNCRKVRNRKLS